MRFVEHLNPEAINYEPTHQKKLKFLHNLLLKGAKTFLLLAYETPCIKLLTYDRASKAELQLSRTIEACQKLSFVSQDFQLFQGRQ